MKKIYMKKHLVIDISIMNDSGFFTSTNKEGP